MVTSRRPVLWVWLYFQQIKSAVTLLPAVTVPIDLHLIK